PVRQRLRGNGGRVYRDGPVSMTLLIDFKTPPAATYPVLRQTLSRYADMLTTWHDGKVEERAVTVILTGSRPTAEVIAQESDRLVAIDGHMTNLDSDVPATVMPELSGDWTTRFHWDGRGAMPEKERAELRRLV